MLQDIIDNISNIVYSDDELEKIFQENGGEIKLVHAIYGAIPVTQKVLDKINGQLVYGLIGQGFIDSDPKYRPNCVQQFTITKIENANGANSERARVDHSGYGFSFEIYLFEGIYCSGSGADPVYVFIP